MHFHICSCRYTSIPTNFDLQSLLHLVYIRAHYFPLSILRLLRAYCSGISLIDTLIKRFYYSTLSLLVRLLPHYRQRRCDTAKANLVRSTAEIFRNSDLSQQLPFVPKKKMLAGINFLLFRIAFTICAEANASCFPKPHPYTFLLF